MFVWDRGVWKLFKASQSGWVTSPSKSTWKEYSFPFLSKSRISPSALIVTTSSSHGGIDWRGSVACGGYGLFFRAPFFWGGGEGGLLVGWVRVLAFCDGFLFMFFVLVGCCQGCVDSVFLARSGVSWGVGDWRGRNRK